MSNDSILNSVKKVIGLTPENTQFDVDVIMHINTVFTILAQLGIGPDTGFSIADSTSKWSDYIADDLMNSALETYVALRVRMYFDPPQNSSLADAINKQIAELEWRLNSYYDYWK